MPKRNISIVTNEIYHVVNRGIASQDIFSNYKEYERALKALFYYQYIGSNNLSLSHFLQLPQEVQNEQLHKLKSSKKIFVEIVAYCLMPNHFHFLLRQVENNGICTFVGNFSNSYTKYFNTLHDRNGPIFQGRFKAVRIEQDEQLVHVSRYIHLNPYSSCLINEISDLEKYPYSSFNEYLTRGKPEIYKTALVLQNFKDKNSYKKFVLDRADYQRNLQTIKNVILDQEL